MGNAVLAFVLHREAGVGLEDRVHRGPFRERAHLAETRYRQIDDAWFAFGDMLVAEAETIDDAGAEALQEHVRALDQSPQDCLAVRMLQVQRDRALAEIGGD